MTTDRHPSQAGGCRKTHAKDLRRTTRTLSLKYHSFALWKWMQRLRHVYTVLRTSIDTIPWPAIISLQEFTVLDLVLAKISQLASGESWFMRSITTCKQQLVRQPVRCFGSGHLGSFLFSQVPRMRSLHRPGAPSTTTTVVLLNRGHFPETLGSPVVLGE
jgi:hypothetical protein